MWVSVHIPVSPSSLYLTTAILVLSSIVEHAKVRVTLLADLLACVGWYFARVRARNGNPILLHPALFVVPIAT